MLDLCTYMDLLHAVSVMYGPSPDLRVVYKLPVASVKGVGLSTEHKSEKKKKKKKKHKHTGEEGGLV